MGLAPGVVIRPIQVKIPKMGLPLELIAGKMQQMQGIKDAFDEMSEMTPTALKLGKGDEDLLKRYNLYVNKLSESVANAFMSGNADKAMKTLVAAKSQLAREWKEGGVATALKDRSVAYQQQLQEYNKREVGKDYTDMHKTVDFYEWKNSIGDIKYDIETGSYTSIGAMGKTMATDIMAKAEQYEKATGIDKTAFVQLMSTKQGAVLGYGLNQQERASYDKIMQQANSFLNDPDVQRELSVRHKYNNIINQRADNPSKLISDASELINSDLKTYKEQKTNLENFNKLSLEEKRKGIYRSSNISSGTGDELSIQEQEFENVRKQYLDKVNKAITELETTLKTVNDTTAMDLAVKTANKEIFSREVVEPVRNSFINRFGVKDNITNVKWFDDIKDDSGKKLSEEHANIIYSTPVPTTAEEAKFDIVKQKENTTKLYTDTVTDVITKLSDIEKVFTDTGNSYAVGDFVLKLPNQGVKELATNTAATTTDEYNDKIRQQQVALGNLTEAMNIVENKTFTEEQKLQQIKDTYGVNDDNAKAIFDELTANSQTYNDVINSYNRANQEFEDIRIFNSRVIASNKENIKNSIIEGTNTTYRFNKDDKTLSLPNGYKILKIENLEQVVEDLFYAYELDNNGVNLSKTDDPRIKRLNKNLYQQQELVTTIPGGLNVRPEPLNVNITNDVVKSLVNNSNFDNRITLASQKYAINKPSEKYTAGLSVRHKNFQDLAMSNSLFDYETTNQEKYTVSFGADEKEEIDKTKLTVPANPTIYVGIDEIGRAYLQYNVEDENKKQGTVKVRLDKQEHIDYVLYGLKEEMVGYRVAAEKGDSSAYTSLIGIVEDLSKIDKTFRSDINKSSILNNTIQSPVGLSEIELNTLEGTPITHKGEAIVSPKTTMIPVGENFVEGKISLYKVFKNKSPYYVIGFKTLDGKSYQLPALDSKLDALSTNEYYDYDTALQQYLLYYFYNSMN